MKISVITINFNNLEGLNKTVNSVLNQTYKNIEYIIIDGASTDGSAEYVKEQKQNFNYWVSESDKGVYNAMNKGIDQATGEYLLFLNSGDYLVDENVIDKLVDFDPVEDIVYGDIKKEYSKKVYYSINTFKELFDSNISHQAIFYKKKTFSIYGYYDERYYIRGDYAHNIKIMSKGSFKHINLVISIIEERGLSADTFDYFFWKDYYNNYIIPFTIISDKKLYGKLWPFYFHLLQDKEDYLYSIRIFTIIVLHEVSIKNTYIGIRAFFAHFYHKLLLNE